MRRLWAAAEAGLLALILPLGGVVAAVPAPAAPPAMSPPASRESAPVRGRPAGALEASARAALPPGRLSRAQAAFLDSLEQRTFRFFWELSDSATGLTPDRWPTRSFSSVGAAGFALTAYPI